MDGAKFKPTGHKIYVEALRVFAKKNIFQMMANKQSWRSAHCCQFWTHGLAKLQGLGMYNRLVFVCVCVCVCVCLVVSKFCKEAAKEKIAPFFSLPAKTHPQGFFLSCMAAKNLHRVSGELPPPPSQGGSICTNFSRNSFLWGFRRHLLAGPYIAPQSWELHIFLVRK